MQTGSIPFEAHRTLELANPKAEGLRRADLWWGLCQSVEAFTGSQREGAASVGAPDAAWAFLKTHLPHVLSQMEGIAEGVGAPVRALAPLLGWGYAPTMGSGCTHLALPAHEEGDCGVLVARTYDFTPEVDTRCELVSVPARPGSRAVMGTRCLLGFVDGWNDAGVYCGVNYGHGTLKNPNGVFFPLLVRIVLEKATSAREGVEWLQGLPHSAPYIFTVCDGQERYTVEVGQRIEVTCYDSTEPLLAVNHYQSALLSMEQARVLPNSPARLAEASLLMSQNPWRGMGRVSRQALLARVCKGHGVGGLCRHDYRGWFGTLWALCLDLKERKGYYMVGAPCQGVQIPVDFQDGFAVTGVWAVGLQQEPE